MNYIKKFAEDHDLVVGQPFHTSASRSVWFTFTDEYKLDMLCADDYDKRCTNFDSILLMLLRGEIKITEKFGT